MSFTGECIHAGFEVAAEAAGIPGILNSGQPPSLVMAGAGVIETLRLSRRVAGLSRLKARAK
jgi:hypothetical protein